MFKLFHKDHPVPKWLQMAFVLAVASSFLVNIVYTLVLMFMQGFTNNNLGDFISIYAPQTIIPLLLFAVAYYLNPRKLHPGERLFESSLLAMTALLGFGVIMQILSYIGLQSLYSEHYVAYQMVTGAIVVIIYATILWQLRASKRWK